MSSKTMPASMWLAIENDGEPIAQTLKDANGNKRNIKAVYVSVGGDAYLTDAAGNEEVFRGMQAGTTVSVRPVSSSTSSSAELLALYGD